MTAKEDDTEVTRKLDSNATFFRFPEAYYRFALEWCSYPHWTVEEAANLLSGCVPHREMFLKGERHRKLDDEILAMENRIRSVLNQQLDVVKSKKYFGKTYILSAQVFDWAKRAGIDIPRDLLRAEQEIKLNYMSDGYTTPYLEAARWVVEEFWEKANLREPPSSGKIIQALLNRYPDLSGAECDMIEKMTRHPLTVPD